MKNPYITIVLVMILFIALLSSCTTAHYPQRGESYPHSAKWEHHDDSKTVK
jgi:hypothetical protein